MRKTFIILSIVLSTMIFGSCSVTDSIVGGVGATHTTRFVIDMSGNTASQESDHLYSKDHDLLLEQVRAIAITHHFVDRGRPIGGQPTVIAHFETRSPWILILRVFEEDERLSVELFQYYEKRERTRRYKELETSLSDALANCFSDRLEIQTHRKLHYPCPW